jgi:hypothetical protein
MASEYGVSLPHYLAQLLEKQVAADCEYAAAHARERELMERGLDLLSPSGQITWTRDSLHER